MRKTKGDVLFCATVISHINSFHVPYIDELYEDGYSIDVMANGKIERSTVRASYDLPFSRNPFSYGNIKAYKKMKLLLKKNTYDVISTNTPIASLLSRFAARKCVNTKVIYIAHGFHFFKGASLINRIVYKRIEKFAARYTDVLITINEEDYRASLEFKLKASGTCVLAKGIGVNTNKSVDMSKEAVLEQLHIPKDAIVLTNIAEFSKNKNQGLLIQCLETMKDDGIYLILCGDGQERVKIEEEVKSKNLKNVIFTGFIKDIGNILNITDIFLFPSFREGLPLALMEAMSFSIPVIASNIRGNKDLIDEKKGGFLFNPKDNRAIFDIVNMIKTISSDLQLKEDMGSYNRNKVIEYDISKVKSTYIDLYEGRVTNEKS